MGRLIYDSGREFVFDDRTLFHLQLVFTAKLRRGESFAFTFPSMTEGSTTRTALWMTAALALEYSYDTGVIPPPNRTWVDLLMESAHSAGGLMLSTEPD